MAEHEANPIFPNFLRHIQLSFEANVLLKELLTEWMGDSVIYETHRDDPSNRPYFSKTPSPCGYWDFNLSHDDDYVVAACLFSSQVALSVGVDIVSRKRTVLHNESLYSWACKESILKATGLGLSEGHLNEIELEMNPINFSWQPVRVHSPPFVYCWLYSSHEFYISVSFSVKNAYK